MNTGTISSPNLVFHHLWDFCSPKCQTNPNPLIICRSQQSIINGLTFYEVNFVTIISHYAFNISHILIMVFWENTQNQHIKDPCNALHLQSSWIIVLGILARRKSTACPQVYAVYKLKGHIMLHFPAVSNRPIYGKDPNMTHPLVWRCTNSITFVV